MSAPEQQPPSSPVANPPTASESLSEVIQAIGLDPAALIEELEVRGYEIVPKLGPECTPCGSVEGKCVGLIQATGHPCCPDCSHVTKRPWSEQARTAAHLHRGCDHANDFCAHPASSESAPSAPDGGS